jgi:hypothetical protein
MISMSGESYSPLFFFSTSRSSKQRLTTRRTFAVSSSSCCCRSSSSSMRPRSCPPSLHHATPEQACPLRHRDFPLRTGCCSPEQQVTAKPPSFVDEGRRCEQDRARRRAHRRRRHQKHDDHLVPRSLRRVRAGDHLASHHPRNPLFFFFLRERERN